ncbi:AAA family ATPase [Curtobacterium sp. ISL-83]|uniref:AAA family ATPase n=1 Tax=Curtobacterium sp. ISL-83 TaxID=2819145 RepID=UPI001BE9BFC7|nr:AAA family ATPase [Curtobacterium sp. ISL-83]MBT2500957.1 AAA family ATPase [Curtobacterium sp. ISL-83]
MDLDAVLKLASDLLHASERYVSPVPPEVLMTMAHGGRDDWQQSAELRAGLYQGLDLLETLRFIERMAGYNVLLTDRGRRALAQQAGQRVDFEGAAASEWIEMQELNAAMSRGLWADHTTFNRLTVENWRQFAAIDIEFHARLTVLTGVNAAGKTTLLNLLAPHFSWNSQFVASRRGVEESTNPTHVGHLTYSNGVRAAVTQDPLWAEGVQQASVTVIGRQDVAGIFISSHRTVSGYQPLQHMPVRFSEAEALLQEFAAEVQTRYNGGMSNFPPLYRMKEGLVSAATYGYGNKAVVASEEARVVWEGFQEVLARLLPADLEFENLLVTDGELLVCTSRGRFPLEAASGGLSAMLELSWQIYLRSRRVEAFTVCIDEPENHLHPELQRSIVPALLEAFPNVRFILATHSPFVVTAVADAAVYALERGSDGTVSSRRLQSVNSAASTDETLTNVLGLSSPMALWVENGIREAVADLPPDPTVDDLRRVQARLSEIGLSSQFPAAIDAIADRSNR